MRFGSIGCRWVEDLPFDDAGDPLWVKIYGFQGVAIDALANVCRDNFVREDIWTKNPEKKIQKFKIVISPIE